MRSFNYTFVTGSGVSHGPIKELKGFKRITIKQGETADVEFTLTGNDLAFFNGKVTLTEPGEFDVWVGPNSDEGLHSDFIIK